MAEEEKVKIVEELGPEPAEAAASQEAAEIKAKENLRGVPDTHQGLLRPVVTDITSMGTRLGTAWPP